MRKKGFTLIELLGVITILATVTVLASYSISAVTNIIKNNIWKNKINIIETGAISYGEDYEYMLRSNGTEKCAFMDTTPSEPLYCLEVNVGYLLQRNYIQSSERDDKDEKIITNDKGESVNDTIVYVWIENGLIYAKYIANEEENSET